MLQEARKEADFEHDLENLDDIEQVFGALDWANANFSQLEAQWRAELATIEGVRLMFVRCGPIIFVWPTAGKCGCPDGELPARNPTAAHHQQSRC